MNDLKVVRSPMLRRDSADGLKYIDDAAVCWEDGEEILVYGGPVAEASEDIRGRILKVELGRDSVIAAPFADMHMHAFQPWWNQEGLIARVGEDEPPRFEGSLPPTLRFETQIRKNPEQAKEIADELIRTMVQNGTGEAVVYGTSSLEAMETLLKASKKAGFGSRFKTGFVFMDQDVDFIDGVELEVSADEVDDILSRILELHQEYRGSVVMIDRFPIAVSSALRKRIVTFCLKHNIPYETHVNEAEKEAARTAEQYNGRRIIKVMKDDGVLQAGMSVRFAHALHNTNDDFEMVSAAIQQGCNVSVVACAPSNLYIRSHEFNGEYPGFPFQKWLEIGARVEAGTDAGAGTTQNMGVVASTELGRRHQGNDPSWTQVYNAVTSNASTLRTGGPVDFLKIRPSQMSFQQSLDPETMVRRVLVAAQNGQNIKSMVLGGWDMSVPS